MISRRLLLAVVLSVGAAVGCSSIDEWQRQAIFNPQRDNPRWFSPPLDGTEEYDVKVASGDTLHFWYVPQPNSASAPTVLYLHGARWNLNGSVFRIARWYDLGFNVLAVDYRGFGKSTEILPSEESARADALAAFDELKRRQPDPARRYIYGHSLGGALAVDLASQLNEPDEVGGVIIESTFTSISDVVKEMKWGWLPGLSLVVTQPFDSAAKIENVKAPLLVVHGTADGVVPHVMADELYRRAGSKRKKLLKIDGGSHSGVRVGADEYRKAVTEFLLIAAPTTAAAVGASGAATKLD